MLLSAHPLYSVNSVRKAAIVKVKQFWIEISLHILIFPRFIFFLEFVQFNCNIMVSRNSMLSMLFIALRMLKKNAGEEGFVSLFFRNRSQRWFTNLRCYRVFVWRKLFTVMLNGNRLLFPHCKLWINWFQLSLLFHRTNKYSIEQTSNCSMLCKHRVELYFRVI